MTLKDFMEVAETNVKMKIAPWDNMGYFSVESRCRMILKDEILSKPIKSISQSLDVIFINCEDEEEEE